MPLSPGAWLNHYEILGHLGTGGMGEVYRARDNKLQREVALKVLPKAFAQDPERVARFRREAQVLAQLNHVNIAAIYSVEESGGQGANYDVSPDGQRFLMVQGGDANLTQLNVVLNWFEELKQRVPVP